MATLPMIGLSHLAQLPEAVSSEFDQHVTTLMKAMGAQGVFGKWETIGPDGLIVRAAAAATTVTINRRTTETALRFTRVGDMVFLKWRFSVTLSAASTSVAVQLPQFRGNRAEGNGENIASCLAFTGGGFVACFASMRPVNNNVDGTNMTLRLQIDRLDGLTFASGAEFFGQMFFEVLPA